MAPAWPRRWPGGTDPVSQEPRRPLTARPRRVRELARPQARVPQWRHCWRGRWQLARDRLYPRRLPPGVLAGPGPQRRGARRLVRRVWLLLHAPTSRH